MSKALFESVPRHPYAMRPPASGTGELVDDTPHATHPLDWSQVVNAAAARLEESWVRPDGTGHMLSSGLAAELAATLCAFSMVAEEVSHMHKHDDKTWTEGDRTPRKTLE